MRGSRIPGEVRKQIRKESEYTTIGKLCRDHCVCRQTIRNILKEDR